MPQAKLKSESFQNLGGINVKASPYLTGPQEYLNLVNFDFQTPGSLTKRWGSTQYFTQSYTGQIQCLFEYNQLSGASYLMFGVSGGVWFGATSGQFQGLSFATTGSSLGHGILASGFFPTPFSFGVFMGNPSIATNTYGCLEGFDSNIRLGYVNGSSAITITQNPTSQGRNNLSIVALNNWLFCCDGKSFFKYDGVTTSYYGLPPAIPFAPNQLSLGAGILFTGATTNLIAGLDYVFAYTFLNRRGFEGPLYIGGQAGQYMQGGGATIGVKSFTLNIAVPKNYDISSVRLYISPSSGVTAFAALGSSSAAAMFNRTYNYVADTAIAAGETLAVVCHGAPFSAAGVIETAPYIQRGYIFKGMTFTVGAGASNTPMILDASYFVPKYLEVYNNQLMMAGFTGSQSTVWFSEVGEPEALLPDNNFEVRTNDGDAVTGMKAFNSQLAIFKSNSYHLLTGDDPTNFALRQASDQYGCLNHKSSATYDDYLVFLDRKGIIRHTGASQETISAKIQDTFDSMNISVAKDTACMVHDKKRNQILTAIPVNGATVNNMTVVYDYLTDSWTKHEGYNAAIFANIQGNLSNRAIFYGGNTGNIFHFGSSFFSDNGTAYTCMIKTRYMSEMGQSIEKQFRRLYINVDPVASSTSSFNVIMYKDYGSTIGFTATMYANPFQSRIDFGISSKSLAFELSNYSATDSVKLHGYVLEYRMQRNV